MASVPVSKTVGSTVTTSAIYNYVYFATHSTQSIDINAMGSALGLSQPYDFDKFRGNHLLNNLISYWYLDDDEFDEHQDAYDAYGSNDGVGSGNGVSYDDATRGWCTELSWLGSNDYIKIPDSATMNPASWSLSFWVYLKSTSSTYNYDRIFGWTGYDFECSILNGNFVCYDGGWRDTGIGCSANSWYHVVITMDSTNGWGIYVNPSGGISAANSYTRSTVRTLSGDLYIGSAYTLGENLPLRMNDLVFWGRALTLGEIGYVGTVDLTGFD